MTREQSSVAMLRRFDRSLSAVHRLCHRILEIVLLLWLLIWAVNPAAAPLEVAVAGLVVWVLFHRSASDDPWRAYR